LSAFFRFELGGNEFDRKMALIAAGQVPRELLFVNSIQHDSQQDSWSVGVSGAPNAPVRQTQYYQSQTLDGLNVGAQIDGYRFGQEDFIPRFNKGGFAWGKWMFLGFGVVPPVLAAGIGIAVSRHRRRNTGTIGTSPAVPSAFSVDRLCFPAPPGDDQLVALLGSRDYSGLMIVQTPDGIVGKPRLIPLKIVATVIITAALGLTGVRWFAPRLFKGELASLAWVLIAVIWFAFLPAALGIVYAINAHFSAMKPYFRVDRTGRTFELPQLGVTLAVTQIDSFVELTRWYKSLHGFEMTRQTGVLASRADGGVDYFPIARDTDRGPFQRSLAIRLAEMMDVKVRVVSRTQRESRMIDDAEISS